MINFQHNQIELNKLEQTKSKCLATTHKLNEEKNNILEDFLNEIEKNKGTDFDIDAEFNDRIMSKMASFGGKISGQTRLFKSELASYLLKTLIENNKDYFKYYTSMNIIVFSKYHFETSPTKQSILKLIDNSIDWKTKNQQHPQYARKDIFQKYLSIISEDEIENKWIEFFENEYSKYRDCVRLDSDMARENLKLIKDAIKN